MHEFDGYAGQRGGGDRGGHTRRGTGAISMRSKSGLAEDEFRGSWDAGLESSMIARKIEEILVLSAYS